MTNKAIEKTDIIIVGGGMVGLSLAAGLIQSDYAVTVIESSEIPDDFSFPVQIRVSALSRASENWLKSLGAWQYIPTQRLSTYRKMKVWQQDTDETDKDETDKTVVEFNATDLAQPDLGHIIENRVIVTALKKSLFELAAAGAHFKLLEQTSAQLLLVDSDQVELILTSGDKIQSQLIVAADGARSWVRKQLNIPQSQKPYAQKALVALIESENNHQKTAWQKFLSTGPLAFLPMKQKNLHSIVWTVTNEMADSLLNTTEATFVEQLDQAIQHKFGSLKLTSDIGAFPLIAAHVRSYVRHRSILVGDAAHSIHPLAGQGVNLGFGDAKALVKLLAHARKDGQQQAGSQVLLRAYERQRRLQNQLTQGAMSVINQGFADQRQLMVLARRYGMTWVNNSTFIKKQLMRQALGLNYS